MRCLYITLIRAYFAANGIATVLSMQARLDLGAPQAFDRVNHVLIDRGLPVVLLK